MDYFDMVYQEARAMINSEKQSVAHRMDHIQRVLLNACSIASNYPKVDIEILKIAVLLHDVEQPHNCKEEHVELSVKTAEKILKNVGYPPAGIEKVLEIISEHSTEESGKRKPSSLEAKILFDADKIDGLNASGIARAFALFGQMGKGPLEAIPWYRKKIEKALLTMQTEEGKEIFLRRLGFVEEFLREIEEENKIKIDQIEEMEYILGDSEALGRDHAGQYVAVHGEKVVATGRTAHEVHALLKNLNIGDAMITYIPKEGKKSSPTSPDREATD